MSDNTTKVREILDSIGTTWVAEAMAGTSHEKVRAILAMIQGHEPTSEALTVQVDLRGLDIITGKGGE